MNPWPACAYAAPYQRTSDLGITPCSGASAFAASRRVASRLTSNPVWRSRALDTSGYAAVYGYRTPSPDSTAA